MDREQERNLYLLVKIPTFGRLHQMQQTASTIARKLRVQASPDVKMWIVPESKAEDIVYFEDCLPVEPAKRIGG